MKKVIITFGIIAGLIIAVWVIVLAALGGCMNWEYGMVYGYSAMLLSFSMIFVAVKSFRDKHNNGSISFGKAFQIGLWITLIASTFYVLTWLVYYYNFIPDFYDKYSAHMVSQMQSEGATATAIEAAKAEIANFKELAKNPAINALMTYMEIVPVGLVVSLLTALILKRKTAS